MPLVGCFAQITFLFLVLLGIVLGVFATSGYPLWMLILLVPIALLTLASLLMLLKLFLNFNSIALKRRILRDSGVETEGVITECLKVRDPTDDECYIFEGICQYRNLRGEVTKFRFRSFSYNAHHIDYAYRGELYGARRIDYNWKDICRSHTIGSPVFVTYLPWLPIIRLVELQEPAWYESLRDIGETGAFEMLLFPPSTTRLTVRHR